MDTVANVLIGESEAEDPGQDRGSHFTVNTFAQTRMTSLEGALQKATVYEDRSNQFDKWLHGVEAKLSAWEPFTIASQPLKRQLEAIEVCTASNEVHVVCMSCTWFCNW